MVEVTLDQCTCTCQDAAVLIQQAVKDPLKVWEVVLIVIIIILIIAALIIGFKKLQDPGEEEDYGFMDEDRYY